MITLTEYLNSVLAGKSVLKTQLEGFTNKTKEEDEAKGILQPTIYYTTWRVLNQRPPVY